MPTIINRRGRPPHPDILTPAEWQVLEGVRAGRTNQEIAESLGVTFHTVKYHISNMLGKLHLRDRQDLAAWRPAPPESESRRPWRALLPFGALKATLGAGSIVATFGLAIGGFLAVHSLNPGDQASGTRLTVTIELDEPLPAGAQPLANDAVVAAFTPSGSTTMPVLSVDYSLDAALPNAWKVAVEVPPLPADAYAVAMTIGSVEFAAPGGQGALDVKVGPWMGYLLDPNHVDLSALGWTLAGSSVGPGRDYAIHQLTPLPGGVEVAIRADKSQEPDRDLVSLVYAGSTVSLGPPDRITVQAPAGGREVTLQLTSTRRATP